MIRHATAADIPEVRRVRAASWRAAYRGIIPPAYLDAMDDSPDEAAAAVRHFLQNPPDRHLLVAERDGRIVGFASCGPEQPSPEQLRTGANRGEVYALYVHPDAWFTGAGAQLLDAARAWLRADGREQVVLWVLAANARARAFYGRQGLAPTGARTALRLGGALLTELQYGGELQHGGELRSGSATVVAQRSESLTPSRHEA